MAEEPNTLALVAEITSSYFRRNSLGQDQIASVISNVAHALQRASRELAGEITTGGMPAAPSQAEKSTPAVSVRASIRPEYLVCLECGAKQKTLKRHLGVAHDLSP